MPLRSRAGSALIDLMVSLVLTGLLGIVLVRASLTAGRMARAELAANALQVAFDGGLGFLAAELAQAGRGADGEDLLRIAPDSLSYRAVRGNGIACRVTPTSVTLLQDRLQSVRLPQPGRDSLLLFKGSDSLTLGGTQWVALPVLGVGGSSCGGAPALRIDTQVDTTTTPLALLAALPPVRLFEVMQVRVYASAGATWLGARSESGGETIQPLAGPFLSPGSAFAYLDSAQAATSAPGSVQRVEVRLSGLRAGWPGGAGTALDSTRITFTPRNLRP